MLAGERAAASLHLTAEAGGVCTRLRHGVCDAVGRPSHASHLRDCAVSRLGPTGGQGSGSVQDDRQTHVIIVTHYCLLRLHLKTAVFSFTVFKKPVFVKNKFPLLVNLYRL